MNETDHARGTQFRVWITRYDQWRPKGYRDVPTAAFALEPAEEGVMSGRQAAVYVEAFNRVAFCRPIKLWAVAVPVTVRYEGEPRPGQRIRHSRSCRLVALHRAAGGAQKSPPRACQASTRDGLSPRESA